MPLTFSIGRLVLAGLLTLTPIRLAADPQVTVSESDGVYTVAASFVVAESPASVMAVLTDYSHLPRFMPGLRTSVVLERAPDRATVEQNATARFLTFSRKIHLILDVHEAPTVLQFVDRNGGDFSRYEGSWRLSIAEGHTEIVYSLVAKPTFSVPGFVLTHLLKRDAGRMIAALQTEITERGRKGSV